MEVNKIVLFF